MRLLIFMMGLALALSSGAETKLFLDFTLNDKAALAQLDEALKVGRDLRRTVQVLKEKAPESEDYKTLSKKLSLYEKQMLKTYGLYPGLNYEMVPTRGTIYKLIESTEMESGLQNLPIVELPNSENVLKKYYKAKVKELVSREIIIQFNRALKASKALKDQISNLEKQLQSKPEVSQKEEIKSGMEKLNKTLMDIENKLETRYSVKKGGRYIFEPESGAVYLALSESDLKRLSDFKQARQKKD